MIKSGKALDAIISRGGAGLRKVVQEQAKMPILSHDGGITHVYIDGDVDIPLAQNIVVNSKVQQPLAANSLDTLLVHQGIARPLLSALILRLLDEFKIDVLGCPKTVALMGQMLMTGHKAVKPAQDADWNRQFQGPTMAIKMVPGFDDALAHIAQHGPSHTCVIVTKSYESAMRFTREVDAGSVLVNASSRPECRRQFWIRRRRRLEFLAPSCARADRPDTAHLRKVCRLRQRSTPAPPSGAVGLRGRHHAQEAVERGS
jgi:glutamate-5-semialdehyde dehydrogenase